MSPYINYSKKNTYSYSVDVNEVYSLIKSHAKRNGRCQSKHTSPIIVRFDNYYVSLQKLANSMMPCIDLKNVIVEFGLEAIMLKKDHNAKKWLCL